MFKQTKRTSERFVKKDFFEPKKIKKEDFIIGHKSIIQKYNFHTTDSLEDIILPKKNEATFIITTRQRASSIILQEKDKIEECYIFCNALHKRYLNEVKCFLKGIIIKENKAIKLFDELEICKNNNIEVKLKQVHTKIIIWKVKENYYILEGSGNPSVNAKIENYIVFNNKEKYLQILNFYKNA